MSDVSDCKRQCRRVLAFVGSQGATLETAADGGVMLRSQRGVIAVAGAALTSLLEQGLGACDGDVLRLTQAGEAARREPVDPVQAQQRELGQTHMETQDGWESVTINLAESPLAQLARRRGKDGRPYLNEAELRAGERLRSDFTRGQLMPKLGATWSALAASGRRGRGAGGAVDLTDAALAARQRVEKAVEATGPELSGVLLDICCFLKGLEQVEAERGWPVRSGKVMLKAALGALARHYEPPPARDARPRSFHWGTDDYRPTLG
jgi:hypothetical protein